MKKVFAELLACLIISSAAPALSQELYVGKDGNVKNVETRAMAIDGSGAFLATRTGLYRIADISQGEKWEEVFSLPAGENEITALNARGRNILLGTRRGLFRSEDGGRNWRNVFRTIIPEKNNILSIDISRYNAGLVAISTAKGVFLSGDLGAGWQDISANLGNKRIAAVALNKESIYAAGDDGLYIRRAGSSAWERIYVNSAEEAADGASDDMYDPAEYEASAPDAINCVKVKLSRIYAGVSKGILYSDDDGAAWTAVSRSGLSGTVNYILPSRKSDKLYCATTKGVFELDASKDCWAELYKGMEKTLDVRSLLFGGDDEKSVWAVTEKGLYRIETGRYSTDRYLDVEKNMKSFRIIFENEPSFRELQQAAMKFCDVSPEKIKNWQRDSRLKALVPKVTCGLDNHRSTNQEIYTSASRDYIISGPDDVYKAVDVSVSWDVSELIWSDSQTNIDVRSRLNTQLRNDILDDLRRAYYERKRLQLDLAAAPPADVRARFERELRVQELTQAIDDLTGNYLSDNMREAKK